MSKFKSLNGLASIRPGYHVRGKLKPVPEGNLAIVQMSDVQPDGSISYPKLTRISATKVAAEYFLKNGDVLLTNRGYSNEAVLVHEVVADTVAASHFYRIRVNSPALQPGYLAWYLNQSAAQKELARYKKTSSIPLLSREGVENLPIPVPPADVQEKISATGALLGQELEILDRLKELRSKLITSHLLTKVSSHQNGVTNA